MFAKVVDTRIFFFLFFGNFFSLFASLCFTNEWDTFCRRPAAPDLLGYLSVRTRVNRGKNCREIICILSHPPFACELNRNKLWHSKRVRTKLVFFSHPISDHYCHTRKIAKLLGVTRGQQNCCKIINETFSLYLSNVSIGTISKIRFSHNLKQQKKVFCLQPPNSTSSFYVAASIHPSIHLQADCMVAKLHYS